MDRIVDSGNTRLEACFVSSAYLCGVLSLFRVQWNINEMHTGGLMNLVEIFHHWKYQTEL